jgi:O-antigen ligase
VTLAALSAPEQAGVAVLGALALVVLFSVRPAWPLSVGLALTVFSGHWAELGSHFAFDRTLLATGFVSMLVRERWGRPDALRTRPVHWLLIVVAGFAVTSALVVGTMDERPARFALLDRLSLIGFALFFIAPMAYREARDRQILVGVMLALGAYLGLTAILETTGPRSLVVPHYITDPSVGIHINRARGPFAEAAANGLALYTCAVVAAIAVTTARSRALRTTAGVVGVLCLLGSVLTVTRAIWLSAAIATVVAMLMTPATRRLLVPGVALAAVGVLLAFAVIPGLEARAGRRAGADRPLWDRENSNAAALRMVEDKPLTGVGWARYSRESLEYYRQSPDHPLTLVRDVHNVYLRSAVELGLAGALLWLFALLYAIVGGILHRGPPELRPWRVGLTAIAVAYAVTALTTPLSFLFPTLALWTFAGIGWVSAAGASRRAAPRPQPSPALLPHRPLPLGHR